MIKVVDFYVRLNHIKGLIDDLMVDVYRSPLNSHVKQSGGVILDILNEFMKESQHDYILKLRVKGTEGEVVMGDLDYNIHEGTGDWIWEINGTLFTVDDVEWIDPDWGIIMLKRTWEERPNHRDVK